MEKIKLAAGKGFSGVGALPSQHLPSTILEKF
jgi:hypothetical protein